MYIDYAIMGVLIVGTLFSILSGIQYGKLFFSGLTKDAGRPSLRKIKAALNQAKCNEEIEEIIVAKKLQMAFIFFFTLFIVLLLIKFVIIVFL